MVPFNDVQLQQATWMMVSCVVISLGCDPFSWLQCFGLQQYRTADRLQPKTATKIHTVVTGKGVASSK
jgi:hypothetical protein